MTITNSTLSVNQTSVSTSFSVVDIAVIIVDIVLIIVICGGNILTLLAVWRTHALRTVPNMYVVSLAVADLLVGLVIPYTMFGIFPETRLLLNTNVYACLFRYSLFFMSAVASVFSLLVISLDRWLYIAKPLRYALLVTPFRAGLAILAIWILAVVYAIVPLFSNNWDTAETCTLFGVLTLEYQVYGQTTSYVACCMVCIIAYFNIFKIAYRQRRLIAVNIPLDKATTKRNRADWHLIKLFLLMFGVFFICWTPTFIFVTIGHTVGLPRIAMDIAGPLSVLNSGMNFFIYAFKNKDFRHAFVKILCTKKYWERIRSNQSIGPDNLTTNIAVSMPKCPSKTSLVELTPVNSVHI